LIDEHVEQIKKFFDHFFSDEMSLNIDVLCSCVKLRIFDQSNDVLIVFVYHYRLRIFDVARQLSHQFRSQMIFLTVNVCFVYSISQMNNVTIDWRFENQLIISLFTLNAYFKVDRLIFWFSVQFRIRVVV
jgi:hypothetical protein